MRIGEAVMVVLVLCRITQPKPAVGAALGHEGEESDHIEQLFTDIEDRHNSEPADWETC